MAKRQRPRLIPPPASRRLIFICSPYSSDPVKNTVLAKELCRAVIDQGLSPFAPHLFFTRFLAEDVEAERQLGIDLGQAWLRAVDEMWIFARDESECSQGMLQEIRFAKRMPFAPKIVWMPECWESLRLAVVVAAKQTSAPVLSERVRGMVDGVAY